MTKPREFWLYHNGIYGSEEEINIYKEGIYVAVTPIHVHEVVYSTQSTTYYIPWEKVWEKYCLQTKKNDDFKLIQELVKRALKGEL